MKVLFVLDSLFGGGTERSTILLLPYLRERGIEPTVAVLRKSPNGDQAALVAEGIEVVVIDGRSLVTQTASLRRFIRSAEPDVVHTALYTSDVVGRLAAWRSGSRVVSSLVNTPYDPARLRDPNVRRWKLRAVQLIDALTARLLTDRLHAVSLGVAEANATALRYPMARIVTVERGRSREGLGYWSAERRARIRADLGVDDRTKLVLSAGRQEFQKGHVDLVRATELLLRTVPDLRVLIAGPEGNATAELQHALEQRTGVQDAVRVLGHRADLADLMVAADAMAMSSLWEGTAGVTLEAIALRCPVVCTNLPGLHGILVHDRTALLVPASDPPRLAEALERVFAEPYLADRLRAEGEADFEARFTLETSADNMVMMYRDLIAPPARIAP